MKYDTSGRRGVVRESEIVGKGADGWTVKTSKQKNGAVFRAQPLIEGGFSTYKAAKDFAESFIEDTEDTIGESQMTQTQLPTCKLIKSTSYLREIIQKILCFSM